MDLIKLVIGILATGLIAIILAGFLAEFYDGMIENADSESEKQVYQNFKDNSFTSFRTIAFGIPTLILVIWGIYKFYYGDFSNYYLKII